MSLLVIICRGLPALIWRRVAKRILNERTMTAIGIIGLFAPQAPKLLHIVKERATIAIIGILGLQPPEQQSVLEKVFQERATSAIIGILGLQPPKQQSVLEKVLQAFCQKYVLGTVGAVLASVALYTVYRYFRRDDNDTNRRRKR